MLNVLSNRPLAAGRSLLQVPGCLARHGRTQSRLVVAKGIPAVKMPGVRNVRPVMPTDPVQALTEAKEAQAALQVADQQARLLLVTGTIADMMTVAVSAVNDPVSEWTPNVVWQRFFATGLPTALYGLGLKELNDGVRTYRSQLKKLEDQTVLQWQVIFAALWGKNRPGTGK